MDVFAFFTRVAVVVVLVCGLLFGGCQESAIVTSGNAAPAAKDIAGAGTIYDIPRVPVKVPDAREWDGDVGFRVAAIVDTDLGTASRNATDFHAARCRLGWNEQGLLVYMDVHDITPSEAPQIWDGDCVEIFVGPEATGNFDRIQYLVAPGRTAEFAESRIAFFHILRDGDHQKSPEAPQYAVRKSGDGYVVELLIPWAAMDVTPAVGLEVGIQMQTGDFNTGKTQYARWAPQIAGPRRPVNLQRIRLVEAGAGSPPVQAAMGREMRGVTAAAFDGLAEASLRVLADGSLVGTPPAVVEIDGSAVGQVTFRETRHGWTEGELIFTVPLPGGVSPSAGRPPQREAVVLLPGGDRATLALGDMLAARRAQFNELEFTFRPWVFAGETLPQFAFKQPLLADILSGFGHKVTVRYFDADAKPVTKAERPGRYGAVVEITALGETKKHFLTLYRVPDGQALDWRTWGGLDLRFRLEGLPEGLGVNPAMWADDPGRMLTGEFKWFLRGSLDNEGFYAFLLAGLSELPEEVAAGRMPPRPSDGPDAGHQSFVFKLKQAIGDDPVYPYYTVTPKDYDNAPDKRWPLVVYLHGAGSRGSNLETVRNVGPNTQEWVREDSPFILAVPQCPEEDWGWTPVGVMAVVDRLIATMRVDPDRVYLTGISMGGFGTWATAASYPDRFAAIAPLCGGMNPEQAIWLKDTPIWAFHGDADDVVPVDFTRGPINRLREANGAPNDNDNDNGNANGDTGVPHIKYTEMPGVGHGIHNVYENRDLYDWLLQQRRPAKP